MDPEANMQEQERIVARARGEAPGEADLERLQELVEALDGWFAAGGFIPSTRTPAGCRRQREDAMAALRGVGEPCGLHLGGIEGRCRLCGYGGAP
jgi:hypothetical protein